MRAASQNASDKVLPFHVNVQKLSSDNKNPNSQNQNYPLNKETKINKAD